MRLISMTDFVLEQTELLYDKNQSKLIHNIVNYAQFLKQPLRLEMFVPCDENGNIPKEPKKDDYYIGGNFVEYNMVNFNKDKEIYKKAKEKVLFEGFVYSTEDDWLERVETDGGLWTIDPDDLIKHTIESMIQCDMTLTQNAIKRLGL